MQMFFRTLALSGFTIALAGCGDFGGPKPPTSPSTPSPYIRVQISGIVIDNDGVPVAGATVEVNGPKSITGDDGRFTLLPIQTMPGSTLGVTARGSMCLSSTANVTATSTELQVEIKVTRRYLLPIDGSETATLRPTDPPARSGNWYPVSSWQTRHYQFTTPADADVMVELSWERVGGAELMLWAYNGDHTSDPVGDRQVITLRRNVTESLYVVQPTQAGPLTQPVRFTLRTQTIR